ncbi:hypothetical protein BBD39_03040 [Arsenophonus endosymbiont of Bemisia tabaci Asia II 3]|nr:hypothetical protein BBD39_03040 [Arsenophonus endosymbiont of Bemisia tabaci Asia II 3]
MNINLIVVEKLRIIGVEMKNLNLWSNTPPPEEAFASDLPFAVDTMAAHEWLQWVLLSKLYKFIEQHIDLPKASVLLPLLKKSIKKNEKVAIANYWNIYVR